MLGLEVRHVLVGRQSVFMEDKRSAKSRKGERDDGYEDDRESRAGHRWKPGRWTIAPDPEAAQGSENRNQPETGKFIAGE